MLRLAFATNYRGFSPANPFNTLDRLHLTIQNQIFNRAFNGLPLNRKAQLQFAKKITLQLPALRILSV